MIQQKLKVQSSKRAMPDKKNDKKVQSVTISLL